MQFAHAQHDTDAVELDAAHTEALAMNESFDAMSDEALDMNYEFTRAKLNSDSENATEPIDFMLYEVEMEKADAYYHTYPDHDWTEPYDINYRCENPEYQREMAYERIQAAHTEALEDNRMYDAHPDDFETFLDELPEYYCDILPDTEWEFVMGRNAKVRQAPARTLSQRLAHAAHRIARTFTHSV